MGGQLGGKKTREPPRSAYQRTSEKNEESKEKQQCREIQLMSVDGKEGIQPRPKAYAWPGQAENRLKRKHVCVWWSVFELRGESSNPFLPSCQTLRIGTLCQSQLKGYGAEGLGTGVRLPNSGLASSGLFTPGGSEFLGT